ncbi:MAG: hypothetical protein IKG37_07895, partial [Solobacterium sp.]|nr:hypothetical protein [Solobacterium sp.]
CSSSCSFFYSVLLDQNNTPLLIVCMTIAVGAFFASLEFFTRYKKLCLPVFLEEVVRTDIPTV